MRAAMTTALLAPVLTLCACERSAPRPEVLVVDVSGAQRVHSLAEGELSGARDGRGYLDLAQLGSGTHVELRGAGKQLMLPAAAFPDRYRLFVKRGAGLQLVEYKGDGAPPSSGSRAGGDKNRRHRERWTVLIKHVDQITFANTP